MDSFDLAGTGLASGSTAYSTATDDHSVFEGETRDHNDKTGNIGGQITLFTKDDCAYCLRVKETLERCVENVLKDHPEGKIEWKIVECKGEMASLCARLTKSFSVPHVFFNQEYIGDCTTTCKLCDVSPGGSGGVIIEKLVKIATGPKLSSPFPPCPDADIIKITDEIACSAQPSEDQLSKLKKAFGFSSVINLTSPLEESYYRNEVELLKDGDAAAPVHYIPIPLVDTNPVSLIRIVDRIKEVPKPVLVHCSTGQRALLVALLAATEGDENVSEPQFVEWGSELGINLGPFSKVALESAKALSVRQNNKQESQMTKRSKSDESGG